MWENIVDQAWISLNERIKLSSLVKLTILSKINSYILLLQL